jgi:hypothetical protein
MMKMVSRNDLLVGILVLIAGILIWEFTPASAGPGAGGLFMPGAMHPTSHYIGAAVAILFGLVGLALYKKVNAITVGISALSIILGIVFLFDAPGMVLFPLLTPHPMAMGGVAGLMVLIGLIGLVGSATLKTKK